MTVTPDIPPANEADIAVIDAPALTPGDAPLCYVVDDESNIRQYLSLILHGAGADTMEFTTGAKMCAALERRVPDIVFHNVGADTADAIESLTKLGKLGFRGRVQLMSNRGATVLDQVKTIGIENGFIMLPALRKPFETNDVVKAVKALKLGHLPSGTARIDLDEALTHQWIELWFQPKIHLSRKQLVGAEGFARARHPQLGVLLPNTFLPNASDSSLLKLAEFALDSALKAGLKFSELGINLRLTINMPVSVLVKAPVEDIVRSYRPEPEAWGGLLIDVPEKEIIDDIALATALAKRLERYNVRLAIDDFGRGHAALGRLKDLPFAELKLDRSFVVNCGSDKVNAPICKGVISLAHKFERIAVGIGVEKAADAFALVNMGCDYGQGFLLGQPMPQERFLSLLRQRKRAQLPVQVRAAEPSTAPVPSAQCVQAPRRLKAKLSE